MKSYLSHLECSETGEKYGSDDIQNLSKAGKPLLARYNIDQVVQNFSKLLLKSRRPDMWRYRELLPVSIDHDPITLGEGFTPLHKAETLGNHLGISNLFIKDESLNPTGSFKARGISAAISAACERGATVFAIPSAGNAAGALSAYAAKAGKKVFVFMPEDTPEAFKMECKFYGASVKLIDGLISDCVAVVNRRKEKEGWYDVSTLKEPYRLEGKKTMGFELAEQLNWELPDVIIYPTGGGTGLIGIWKAFDELEQMGWIGSTRPRMVAVQAEGCAPIVRAFRNREKQAEPWQNAHTVASGLRVPGGVGDFLILQALRNSEGTAIAVSDKELIEASKTMAANTGIFPAPEGGATLAALIKLKNKKWIQKDDRVVLLNTGSGLKYQEAFNPSK